MDVSVSMQAEVSQLHYNDYTEFQLDPPHHQHCTLTRWTFIVEAGIKTWKSPGISLKSTFFFLDWQTQTVLPRTAEVDSDVKKITSTRTHVSVQSVRTQVYTSFYFV